ncbi:MAG: heavy metal translocating P-type ATPase [Lachnospiraceae bacterium]
MNKKQKKLLLRVAAAGAMLLVLMLLPLEKVPVLRFFLFLIPYFTVGYDILRKAWKGILHRQVFDENFLMAIATIGAMALGEYAEGVAVMWFYQIGELFQSYAVGKSRQNITALMDIRPDYANLEEDGEITRVDPDEVEVGSLIVVGPGEKIPIDGIIEEGNSTLNTAALTGESLPRDVGPGDEVLSGCVNTSGLLRIRTTREFEESTASKILDLVENASSRKSESEQFITKFARYYTPAVCFAAFAVAVLPPLARILFGEGWFNGGIVFGEAMTFAKVGEAFATWIYRALTFLVISCPCAIVVSIPLSFFGGIGGASSQGILIKGSNYMETLANVRTVAFDKTGTITKGNFEVAAVHHAAIDNNVLLEMAALAESHSTHPISRSLALAYGKTLDKSRILDVREISGQGVVAQILGSGFASGKERPGSSLDQKVHTVAVGNLRLMEAEGIEAIPCRSVGTIVHMAVDGKYVGHIVISDEMKPTAAEAMQALRAAGVRRTVMLTGDKEKVAAAVAKEVGIDEVRAELLPAEKVEEVEKLLGSDGIVAFVGDGINDAPVLRRADIGIAMGALGSDAAIEAADVVLMDDDPMKISKAIRIAGKCIRIVKENIYFAIFVKLTCLVLGTLGIANMWIAIFADVGVMVLCVLNAVRCLAVKKL